MTMYFIGISLVLCFACSAYAAQLAENDVRFHDLVHFTEKEVAAGHPYIVNGVYMRENGAEENEYVVRLEVDKEPSELCSVTLIDSVTPGMKYQVLDKGCLQEVEEEPVKRKTNPHLCTGCPEDASLDDPLAKEAANFARSNALSRYNGQFRSNQEPATEVKVISVKSQVVSGVNHIFELEFIKDGKPIETCEAVVWTQTWRNPPRKLTDLKCGKDSSNREAKEGA